ncbi:hypothetical protein ACHAWF_012921 [Thalassiosira exigua]
MEPKTDDRRRLFGAAESSVREYLCSFLEKSSYSSKTDAKTSCSPDPDLEELRRPMPDEEKGVKQSFDRVFCCGASRSFYCKECCRLLVPDHSLPSPISGRSGMASAKNVLDRSCSERRPLKLPFNLHIILDDRRGSATGLHAVALLNNRRIDEEHDDRCCTDDQDCGDCGGDNHPNGAGPVTLIDTSKGDEVPHYGFGTDATYLLFPSPGKSVPLDSVSSQVQTLVVLDCKWTHSGNYLKSEQLSSLPRVHLSCPPRESYYWRWHNAGFGAVSTIEAIYYAAFEVLQTKIHSLLETNQKSGEHLDDLVGQENLVHLLWLFGLQRAAILKSAKDEGIPAPFSDEGKELQREMRRQKGTWRQLRHKEDERRLREKKLLQKEREKART